VLQPRRPNQRLLPLLLQFFRSAEAVLRPRRHCLRLFPLPFLTPQVREQDNLPDGGLIGEQHRQSIDPHPETAVGWHTIAHRP
jgi:hypothetical protein